MAKKIDLSKYTLGENLEKVQDKEVQSIINKNPKKAELKVKNSKNMHAFKSIENNLEVDEGDLTDDYGDYHPTKIISPIYGVRSEGDAQIINSNFRASHANEDMQKSSKSKTDSEEK